MLRTHFLAISFILLSIIPHSVLDNKTSETKSVNKALLLKLINQARKNGCTCANKYYSPVPEVKWNEQLEKAAKEHSQDMNDKRYFSHIGTDGSDAGTRIANVGYKWINFAENIGMGYKNEEEVMDGWLHSSGHCKNIMNKAYSEIGVANVNGYWTLDLASR